MNKKMLNKKMLDKEVKILDNVLFGLGIGYLFSAVSVIILMVVAIYLSWASLQYPYKIIVSFLGVFLIFECLHWLGQRVAKHRKNLRELQKNL